MHRHVHFLQHYPLYHDLSTYTHTQLYITVKQCHLSTIIYDNLSHAHHSLKPIFPFQFRVLYVQTLFFASLYVLLSFDFLLSFKKQKEKKFCLHIVQIAKYQIF